MSGASNASRLSELDLSERRFIESVKFFVCEDKRGFSRCGKGICHKR
jgi:hypothetical protein